MIISPLGLTKLHDFECYKYFVHIQNSSSSVWPQSAFLHFLAMHSIHGGRKFYRISQSWFVDTLVGSNQQRPLSRFVLIVFAITDSLTLPPICNTPFSLASLLCSRKNGTSQNTHLPKTRPGFSLNVCFPLKVFGKKLCIQQQSNCSDLYKRCCSSSW